MLKISCLLGVLLTLFGCGDNAPTARKIQFKDRDTLDLGQSQRLTIRPAAEGMDEALRERFIRRAVRSRDAFLSARNARFYETGEQHLHNAI